MANSIQLIFSVRPEEEGKNHINVHFHSKFYEARLLYPVYGKSEISSIFGFKYTAPISLIGYLRYDKEIFERFMSLEKDDAIAEYGRIKSTLRVNVVKHFRACTYAMYLERAVQDEDFRSALLNTGNLPLLCYKPITITAKGSCMIEARPLLFNRWLPEVLETVRATLREWGTSIEDMTNPNYPNDQWLRSFPNLKDADESVINEIRARVVSEIYAPLSEGALV